MDPASILGIAGSILGISDIIARSLKGLIGLQSTYKSANLLIAIIIGHLTTVKAALHEIQRWISDAADSLSHELLTSDLQRAVDSCEIIVLALDDRVSSLTQDSSTALSAKARITLAFEEQSIKGFSDHLGNQVQALNLLVTAANCRTSQARNDMLHANETRQLIRQIEDDSSSYMHGDGGNSILTRRSIATNNTLLLDNEFDFDDQVLTSKVYRQALRSILEKSKQGADVARAQPRYSTDEQDSSSTVEEASILSNDTVVPLTGRIKDSTGEPPVSVESNSRTAILNFIEKYGAENTSNETISSVRRVPNKGRRRGLSSLFANLNRYVNKDESAINKYDRDLAAMTEKSDQKSNRTATLPLQPATKLLILGTSETGKSTLLKDLKLQVQGPYDAESRHSFKEIIFSNAVQSMRVILEAMESLDIPIADTNIYHAQSIFMQPVQIETKNLSRDAGEAIIALRSDAGVKVAMSRAREYQLTDAAQFWFDEVERLMHDPYIPTDHDILRSRVKTTGITETQFQFNNVNHFIFDVGGVRSERKKWIHVFEKVDVIVFTADISNWDQLLFEDETVNRMEEQLTLFDSLVNSRWFTGTQFILLFTKVDRLKKKLGINSPCFSDYFPDAPKRPDVEQAKAYIENRFLLLNNAHETKPVKVIYSSFVEGPSPASLVMSALKQNVPNPI